MIEERMVYSLDVGSSKIVALVGSIGEDVKVHGISTHYYTSNSRNNDFRCVTNGVISDLDGVRSKVSQVLNEARINADCSLGMVICNISGSSIGSVYSTSEMAVNGKPITAEIMADLIDDALKVKLPAGYEILDYEVQEYVLDKEHYAINPINLFTSHIGCNINTFAGNSSQISNLNSAIKNNGFNSTKLVPSGILSGLAVLNHEEKELGCCLIDIGAGVTDIVVYENGFVRYLCSLPIGGEMITRDLANVTKIARNLAEDVKLNHGLCGSSYSMLAAHGLTVADHRGLSMQISHKLINDVISDRLKDIFTAVKTALIRHKLYDIISSGIVITGGGANLAGIAEFAAQTFELPVRVGLVQYSGEFEGVVANPKFATSMGALYFAKEYLLSDVGALARKNKGGAYGRVLKKFRQLILR